MRREAISFYCCTEHLRIKLTRQFSCCIVNRRSVRNRSCDRKVVRTFISLTGLRLWKSLPAILRYDQLWKFSRHLKERTFIQGLEIAAHTRSCFNVRYRTEPNTKKVEREN